MLGHTKLVLCAFDSRLTMLINFPTQTETLILYLFCPCKYMKKTSSKIGYFRKIPESFSIAKTHPIIPKTKRYKTDLSFYSILVCTTLDDLKKYSNMHWCRLWNMGPWHYLWELIIDIYADRVLKCPIY